MALGLFVVIAALWQRRTGGSVAGLLGMTVSLAGVILLGALGFARLMGVLESGRRTRATGERAGPASRHAGAASRGSSGGTRWPGASEKEPARGSLGKERGRP